MMETPSDRLPLVIGVTGHRDLRVEDVPRLEREVAGVIAGLRRDYLDDDAETPIVVLSALAEGADRLAARVLLAQGARLIAPLPLPLEEYRRDFEPGLTPGNIAEFDALLAQAIAAPVMPLHGTSLDVLRGDRKKRAEQYRAVGIFITQHCHVLLALWDGDDEDMAVGGTAEVVSFKRNGIPLMVRGSPRGSLDASEIGPVIEIVTPRIKATSAATEISVRRWGREVIEHYRGGIIKRALRRVAAFLAHVVHYEFEDHRAKLPMKERRELEIWENFEALIDLTRDFNREAAALANDARGQERAAQSIKHLFADSDGGTVEGVLAEKHAMGPASLWCKLYAVADALAQIRQSQFKRDWKLMFGLGFIAFLCFAMFAHAGYLNVTFLASYILAFVVIVILFARAVLGRHQERYLDYRALAEALRVAVYWKLLGIGSRYVDAKTGEGGHDFVDTNPVGVLADAYPIKQPNELAWVKICLRTLERLDQAAPVPTRGIDPIGHAIARRFWVNGQFAYFGRQGFRHNSFAETVEAHCTILLVLSPFVIAPLLLHLLMRDTVLEWHGIDVTHVVLVFIGVLPGVAAAWTGYSEKLAYKAQARQYDRMRELFERAYALLPPKIDDQSMSLAHALYRELGMEAMKENAEWVAIYRQRPIQPLQ